MTVYIENKSCSYICPSCEVRHYKLRLITQDNLLKTNDEYIYSYNQLNSMKVMISECLYQIV